jgi:hypothetical protein
MIIGIAQEFIDPPVGRAAGTGREFFFLFRHGCTRQINVSEFLQLYENIGYYLRSEFLP